MKLKDIIRNKEWIMGNGYGIENNIIERVDIKTIAHFGNCTCLEILCANIVPYSARNNTKNLGALIKALIEFLDIAEEDGVYLSKIKNIPIRLVFEGTREGHFGEKAIGIGDFLKDRFVLFDDFSTIELE